MENKQQLADLLEALTDFRDKRDWKVFHTPKNLALSVSIESSEILELFQWMSEPEVETALEDPEFKERLGSEIADTLIYLTLLAGATGIDPLEEAFKKVAINEGRFPTSPNAVSES